MNSHHYCIIMAGGLGKRFWPISRAARPKQFLDFTCKGHSFLRQTYDRMSKVIPEDNMIVVTLERYVPLVKEQIPCISDGNILVEPYGRDTAPCLSYAARTILKRDSDAVMVAAPSDHIIPDEEEFLHTVSPALDYASEHDSIVTLGIKPTRPDTSFGYIQVSGGAQFKYGSPVKVKTFTEKPDAETAAIFLKSGEFLWNSGIFICRADVLLEEVRSCAPEIAKFWSDDRDLVKFYSDCPRTSIDYAVMEKTDRAMVIPSRFKWADIGNWSTLYDYLSHPDEYGNAIEVAGVTMLRDNRDNIVFSDKPDKLTAISGLSNMMVVDMDDVLLVCPREETRLKEFLSGLVMPEYERYR